MSAGSAANAVLISGDTADVERNEDGTLGFAGATFRAGASTSSGSGRNGLFVFDLTSFAGQTFSSADVQLTLASISGNPSAFNVDIYGAGYSNAASTFPAAADYYEGIFAGDTTNTTGLVAIQDNFVPAAASIPANTAFATNVAGDTALLAFLNARPAGQNFVFFRVSPDVDAGNAAVGYNFHSADATTSSFRPQLGLNQQVPEPSTIAGVTLAAAGLLARRKRQAKVG